MGLIRFALSSLMRDSLPVPVWDDARGCGGCGEESPLCSPRSGRSILMQAATIRDASGPVIVALMTAGRSRATIKRHEAEFNAFAGFLEARGRALPTEADCLDFIAERSGCRLAGLREPTSSRRAQLARRPLMLLMEALAGGVPEVGQATTPPVERCPARFRAARDEYLAACRRRRNAD